MASFERPILIYSDYCIHSKNFLQSLMKHPDIYNMFIRMNIDVNPQTKQRPRVFYQIQEQLNKKIVRVPTIIVKNKSEILLLSDKDSFKWLDFQIESKKENVGIKGFNLNEMGSFSDGYSKFIENGNESTHINDANEQSFKFYKNINGERVLQGENFQVEGEIKTPESFRDKNFESSTQPFDQSIYNNMENTRKSFGNPQQGNPSMGMIPELQPQSIQRTHVNDSEYNMRVNQFNGQQHQKQTIPQIDFTSQNFGLSRELGGVPLNNNSQKSKELDARLNQLMMDRQ